MKKKILSLSLAALLGLSLPCAAAPYHGHCHGGYHHPAPMVHHHPHNMHRPAVGVSFSTGVLARRSYWDPFYCYDCPIVYPRYNYPVSVAPAIYFNFGI